jgi:hypothetical protein
VLDVHSSVLPAGAIVSDSGMGNSRFLRDASNRQKSEDAALTGGDVEVEKQISPLRCSQRREQLRSK